MGKPEEATAGRAKMIEQLEAARGRCPLSGAKRTKVDFGLRWFVRL